LAERVLVGGTLLLDGGHLKEDVIKQYVEFQFLKRRLQETIPVNKIISLEREIVPTWLGRGLYGCRSEGRFLDIGTPESYTIAEQFFDPKRLT
jgi:NDP-sugar pyrophosphorylase family protein